MLYAKPPSELEVLNDKSGMIVNFHRIMKTEFDLLRMLVQSSPR